MLSELQDKYNLYIHDQQNRLSLIEPEVEAILDRRQQEVGHHLNKAAGSV